MANDEDDARIRRLVLEEMESDERLSSQPIEVRVEGGRVTLAGDVQSFVRKLAAQEVADSVAGAANVDNRIEVAPAESPDDEKLASQVRELLERNEDLIEQAVLVESRAGRVTLLGSVATEEERLLAGDVALQAPGAREVRNQLVIAPSGRSESVVVARELQHELENDPQLEGCELVVAVSGDVLVLSGSAKSPLQVERAVAHLREIWAGELREEVTSEG